MAISEKTRKVLWGRSGNRCALCRRELVVDATVADDESVVGDECHLVSGKTNGPRYDPGLPPEQLDQPGNLILLCRVHHKMVDDQRETYTLEVLQKLKTNHEAWVSSSLAEEKPIPPVRIRRIKENIPRHLVRLTAGRDVTAIIGDASAFSFEHDEPESEADVDLIASFLQEAQDWGDIWASVEAGDRVKTAFRLGTLLHELEEAGFWVFGGREVQRLEGGIGAPHSFPVAILRVLRSTNPEVITIDGQQAAPESGARATSSDTGSPSSTGDV